MQTQPQQKPGPLESLRGSLNLSLFICRTWATSLEVFLHRQIGGRYLGWNAAAVLLLVPLYSLAWEHYDLRPMVWFLLAYLGMCILARLGMVRRRLRGQWEHSLYTGWPRCMGPKSKWSELTVKRWVEPIIALMVGYLLRDFGSAPLGTYLMLGAGCLFVSVNASDALEQARYQDMNDTVLEQQATAERFREMRG